MSDLICRRTMRRCDTSGMCSPHGGCQPAPSAKETLENLTQKDWEMIALKATVAQQAQMIEHLRGGPTPGYTAVDMANAAADGFRDGVASKEKIIDALLNHCEDGECHVCSQIICPHGDGMHFHHDGCPSCAQDETT